MDINLLKKQYKAHKEKELHGRYIYGDHINPLLKKHKTNFDIQDIGKSVLGESIHAVKIGTGNTKILMWSQMHGNESTTTKALFDLCNVFSNSELEVISKILSRCTIVMIPLLNPDGAKAYSRFNANDIDLNRDAQTLSQPESKVLRLYFDDFKPNFCFNLHGQRTIFSAGDSNHPATVSFLAPAQDENCTVTKTREHAMEIIVKMNDTLQIEIAKQVGIYDDAYNINCVGDTFQSLDVPTVLIEAGHYNGDYDREVVREFIFQSLLVAMEYIALNDVTGDHHLPYFDIPQNKKLFYDIIIRHATVTDVICDVAIQYREELRDNKVDFIPVIEQICNLNDYFGHKDIMIHGNMLSTIDKKPLIEGYENDFVLINNQKFALKP